MTHKKRKRINITMDKQLLISIINTMENGQNLDNHITKLLKAGLKADGKL
jgi:hypothetical protein